MIPDESLSLRPRPGTFLSPDSRSPQLQRHPADTSPGGRCLAAAPRDWELGGYALEDTSGGFEYRVWQFRYEDDAIYVGPDPDGPWTLLLEIEGVTEISGSFDLSMRPLVAMVDEGLVKLWWYDETTEAYGISEFPDFTSPRLTLDDKRATQLESSDVLFFYLLSGNLCYRQLSEKFDVERLLCAQPANTTRLGRVGMTSSNRVQIEFITR